MNKDSFSYLSAVEIFILDDNNRVLLIERALNKKVMPGYYNGLGGKMDRKDIRENPLIAAYRELEEEAGITKSQLSELRLKGILNSFDRFGSWIVFEYVGRLKSNVKSNSFNKDIDEGKLYWIIEKDFNNINLVPDLRDGSLSEILFSNAFIYITSAYDDKDNMIFFRKNTE